MSVNSQNYIDAIEYIICIHNSLDVSEKQRQTFCDVLKTFE